MIIYRQNTELIEVLISDKATERKELMVEHSVSLDFELSEYLKLEKGDYITHNGKNFYLNKDYIPGINKSTNGYKYDLKLYDITERFKDFQLKYNLNGYFELDFRLTQTGEQHVQIVLAELGRRGIAFTLGEYPIGVREIHYENLSIWDALNLICETYEMEWWTDGSILNVGKCETDPETTITLTNDVEIDSYSFSSSSEKFITRLYAFGGTRNIPLEYRTGQSTTDNIADRRLKMQNDSGSPVDYVDLFENLPVNQIVEGVEIFDDVYPKQNFTVSQVSVVEYDGNGEDTQDTIAYKIKSNAPVLTADDIMPGQPLMIAFTSGHLTGQEFELINHGDELEIKYNQDGNYYVPNHTLKPAVYDTFFLFNVKADVLFPSIIPIAENELYHKAKDSMGKMGSELVWDVTTRSILCEQNDIDLEVGQSVELDLDFLNPVSRVRGYEKKLINKYECKYIIGDSPQFSRLRDLENKIDSKTSEILNLKTTIETTFKDGVISDSELKALKRNLKDLEREKDTIQTQLNALLFNQYLGENTLQATFDAYLVAYENLVTSITDAIADNYITETERQDVFEKLSAYGQALAEFQVSKQSAESQINADIYESQSGNLLRNSGFTGDYATIHLDTQKELENLTELTGDKLVHWVYENCLVVENENAKSGYSCEIGTLSQTVDLIVGKKHILTCYAHGVLKLNGVDFHNSTEFERVEYIFIPETKTITISGAGEIYDLQLERGVVPTEWKPNFRDESQEIGRFLAYNYITDAIKNGSTSILGGLILSQMIQLGNYKNNVLEKVTAGLSGVYNDGSDPLLWGGGTLEEAIRRIANPLKDKFDESGLPLANFAIDHAGNMYAQNAFIRGVIHAIDGVFSGKIVSKSGKIGGLDIFLDTLKSNSMSFTETNVGSLSSLIFPVSRQVPKVEFIAIDKNIHVYTDELELDNDCVIEFNAKVTPDPDLTDAGYRIEVKCGGDVIFSEIGIGSVEKDFEVPVKAGRYTIHAHSEGFMKIGETYTNSARIKGINTDAIIVSLTYPQTKIGKDGLYSYWNIDKYLYFSSTYGFELRFGSYGIQITTNGLKKYNGTNWVLWN